MAPSATRRRHDARRQRQRDIARQIETPGDYAIAMLQDRNAAVRQRPDFQRGHHNVRAGESAIRMQPCPQGRKTHDRLVRHHEAPGIHLMKRPTGGARRYPRGEHGFTIASFERMTRGMAVNGFAVGADAFGRRILLKMFRADDGTFHVILPEDHARHMLTSLADAVETFGWGMEEAGADQVLQPDDWVSESPRTAIASVIQVTRAKLYAAWLVDERHNTYVGAQIRAGYCARLHAELHQHMRAANILPPEMRGGDRGNA